MVSKRSWTAYPVTYRAREMKILAGWIQAGESGSIIGLAGAGKSNLLGFLSHRPEVIQPYLPADFGHLVLVQVDLNNLPGNDLATLFRVILRSLYEARGQLVSIEEALATPVETLYRKVEEKTDPFLSQSALREALLLFQEQAIRLVLVLDPFDQFCATATGQVLDNLRGLRDSFKDTLSFLIGLRREVAYIRNPVELGELFEIVDTHQCWLGPMDKADARWVVGQVEAAINRTFSATQVDRLIELTGGYPALLRAASLWLAQVSPVPEMDAWADRLLAEASIQNRLRELRQGLTGEEEAALSALQMALIITSATDRQETMRQISQKYQETLVRLQVKGLCQQTESGWRFLSPLLAKFVAEMEGVSAGKIWCELTTQRFFLDERELTSLSERDRRLLQYFLDNPRLAHRIDDLIEAVWTDEDSSGVSNEAVQQAIRHLRKQIEPNPAKPCYLITERGTGYRFFPEGAPRG
jgi:hypothetical protein